MLHVVAENKQVGIN